MITTECGCNRILYIVLYLGLPHEERKYRVLSKKRSPNRKKLALQQNPGFHSRRALYNLPPPRDFRTRLYLFSPLPIAPHPVIFDGYCNIL